MWVRTVGTGCGPERQFDRDFIKFLIIPYTDYDVGV